MPGRVEKFGNWGRHGGNRAPRHDAYLFHFLRRHQRCERTRSGGRAALRRRPDKLRERHKRASHESGGDQGFKKREPATLLHARTRCNTWTAHKSSISPSETRRPRNPVAENAPVRAIEVG